MTLEEYLRHDAELYPDKTAVVCGAQEMTYRQLWEATLRLAARYRRQYPIGTLVPFRATCSIDALVKYFAIHQAGCVAMPLEKNLPDDKLAAFERLAAEHQDSLVTLAAEQQHHEAARNKHHSPADVLFTTGTTGQQKGVVISHDTIVADAENLIEAQGFHHGMTFVINGPLNHIGSLSKVYPIILVGGTLHLIDGMKDMDAFFAAVERAGTHVATFLVPASIRMLLTFAAKRLASCSDRLEMIETGAAPIAQSDMEQLCRLLPHTRLFNTYASTETGIIATYNFNEGDCLAGCLGKSMRHSSMFITEDGHVACKGSTLMMGYLGDEALTQTVLRDDTVFTADLGRIDPEGRLHLQGRMGDVFNIGGYKVMPNEVEDAALSLPGVKDCVCTMVQHRVLGNVLRLLVVMQEGFAFDKRSLARGLQQKLERHKIPMLYEHVDAIKRTFNGKIDRKAYL